MAQFPRPLALLTDMDGTLLNPDKTLSPKNAAAIAGFRAKGGRFSIATGRSLEATRPYLELLQPDLPAVMYNGALIYDWQQQKPLYTVTLPQGAREALKELLAYAPGVGAEVLNAQGVFVVKDNEFEQKHLEITKVQAQFVSPDDVDLCTCFKALFAGAPAEIDRLEAFAAQPQFAAFAFTRSHSWFLEMLPPAVSKGAALEKIRAMLPEGAIIGAAGDFDNDLAMLAAADFCGCPADAQPVVRETVAKLGGYVSPCPCKDDFFADFIADFLRQTT